MAYNPNAIAQGFPRASFDTVVSALIAGFDGVPLSDGKVLTSTDKVFTNSAISDAVLPFISFQVGAASVSSNDWQPWVEQVSINIPAVFKCKVDWVDAGTQQIRQYIDDLYKNLYAIKGLYVTKDSKLVPYHPGFAKLLDDGEIEPLVDRIGPRITSVTIREQAGTPFIDAELNFTLEFLAKYDPREYTYVREIAIGVTPVDLARRSVPGGWTPGTPPNPDDVKGYGLYTSENPEFGDIKLQHELPVFTWPFPADYPKRKTHDSAYDGAFGKQVVTIDLIPHSIALAVSGTSSAFTIVYHLLDGSTQAGTATDLAWTSSNTSVATISGSGIVTGVGAGTTSVHATYLGITSNSVTITVS